MTSFTRLSIHSFLPIFSWTRQRQVPRRGALLQVEVVSAHKNFSTELILFKDESPHELSYTSLRDLLSTNRNVCLIKSKRESTCEDRELEDERPAIKNRLVELAARAYLLPSHAQATPANQFFSRQWARFTSRTCLHSQHSNITLQSTPNISCLPGPLWVDITRAFCSLFKLSHLRPQPVLRL